MPTSLKPGYNDAVDPSTFTQVKANPAYNKYIVPMQMNVNTDLIKQKANALISAADTTGNNTVGMTINSPITGVPGVNSYYTELGYAQNPNYQSPTDTSYVNPPVQSSSAIPESYILIGIAILVFVFIIR